MRKFPAHSFAPSSIGGHFNRDGSTSTTPVGLPVVQRTTALVEVHSSTQGAIISSAATRRADDRNPSRAARKRERQRGMGTWSKDPTGGVVRPAVSGKSAAAGPHFFLSVTCQPPSEGRPPRSWPCPSPRTGTTQARLRIPIAGGGEAWRPGARDKRPLPGSWETFDLTQGSPAPGLRSRRPRDARCGARR